MFKSTTLLLASALMSFTPAMAQQAPDVPFASRTITITGHGEVRAAPDMASVMMGVSSFAATANAALELNTKTMDELMGLLAAEKIDNRDISTSNFSVNPRFDYGQGGTAVPKVIGYDVTNMVTVTVRQFDSLGALLDKAVSTGTNQVNGITFIVSKPEAMLDEARKLALTDAKRKAAVYAAAGGFQLGEIVQINEGGAYQPPMPMYGKAAAEAASPVPVARGEQILVIDVNMTWSIK